MELTHDFTVPASIEDAWATFMDLERVGGCFPGATVTEVNDDSFSGQVKVKLGPIALVYTGSGSFIERDDAAHRAVIEAKGKDKRGNGTAGATVTVQLAPSGAGTRVDVTTDLAITGKPAQFGRGVMQDVSDKLLQQFVGCIESQFTTAATESAPEQESNAETDFDRGFVEAAAGVGPASAAGSDPTSVGTAPEVAPMSPKAKPAAAGPSTTSAPAPQPAASAPRSAAASRPAADDSIDLGATVMPVLIKSYLPYGILAAVGAVIGYLIGRRRSR